MSIEDIRRRLDAKCATWGCPQASQTLYDDMHPCTEALCKFRAMLTAGATEEQWRALSDEVDAIHAANWPKMLAAALRARIPPVPCAGVYVYRGGIHTSAKANRLVEKINSELDRAVDVDPTIARNYFVRAETMLRELETISRGNIAPALAAFIVLVMVMLLIVIVLTLLPPTMAKNYPRVGKENQW